MLVARIPLVSPVLGVVSGAMGFTAGAMSSSLRAVRREESLGPFFGDDAIFIFLVLPRVAFTRAQRQGESGNHEAQKFHRAL